jgi:hypothetical protein
MCQSCAEGAPCRLLHMQTWQSEFESFDPDIRTTSDSTECNLWVIRCRCTKRLCLRLGM